MIHQGRMQDFLRGGGNLGLHAEKGGGSFGPNVKKPTSWAKRGEGVQTPRRSNSSAISCFNDVKQSHVYNNTVFNVAILD